VPPSERDADARRLFLAACFGLVVPLLWFYAVYLFLNTAFGEGRLSSRGRTYLFVGGLVVGAGFFLALFLMWWHYGSPFP
jgi:hypothetical protein